MSNIQTQRPVGQMQEHNPLSHGQLGKGNNYPFGDNLRIQNKQTEQTFPQRKRLRSNYKDQSETDSDNKSMETEKFLSNDANL